MENEITKNIFTLKNNGCVWEKYNCFDILYVLIDKNDFNKLKEYHEKYIKGENLIEFYSLCDELINKYKNI